MTTDKPQAGELKPCIGCGQRAIGPYGPDPETEGRRTLFYFECDTIDCPTWWFDATDRADAIAQFNTRAPASAPSLTLDEARKIVEVAREYDRTRRTPDYRKGYADACDSILSAMTERAK